MPLCIDLNGRRALVSGVTSGIGAAIARTMAEAGCDVAGCGRSAPDSEGARSFLQAVESNKRKAFYHEVDLSRAEEAVAWVNTAAGQLGGLDIVVSNAGRNVFTSVSGTREEDWRDAIDLDLASHWRVARAARAHLENSDQAVVQVITSNHAFATMAGCFPYNVAKAGLVALVQSLAIEWGPKIRAVGIAPGFIDTAGNQTWFDSFADPAAERLRTERLHPVGRLGTAAEVGSLCAFLASPMAGFISGTTLLIDGGRSALMQDDPEK